jgi:hypothetical protein
LPNHEVPSRQKHELIFHSQEEPEDYPFPLTLKQKNKSVDGDSGTHTPTLVNGTGKTVS